MVRGIVIALLIVVAALVLAVFLLRKEPPRMPRDADHLPEQSEQHCLTCHGPGEKTPRKPTHPNANDCFRCHTLREAS